MNGARCTIGFCDQVGRYELLNGRNEYCSRSNLVIAELRRTLILDKLYQLLFLMAAAITFLLLHTTTAAVMLFGGKQTYLLYPIHAIMNIQCPST